MSDHEMPYVDENGVLHDPVAAAVIHAVERINCEAQLRFTHADRVRHFVDRIRVRGLSPRDVVIVLLNVDDRLGGVLADILMPDHDWNSIRARGEVPWARGLAQRAGIEAAIRQLFPREADRLQDIETAVVMMDRGIVAVFDAQAVL